MGNYCIYNLANNKIRSASENEDDKHQQDESNANDIEEEREVDEWEKQNGDYQHTDMNNQTRFISIEMEP